MILKLQNKSFLHQVCSNSLKLATQAEIEKTKLDSLKQELSDVERKLKNAENMIVIANNNLANSKNDFGALKM